MPIYLIMDNAGGYGTKECIESYVKLLKDKYNIIIKHQIPRSPETNVLDLGIWNSISPALLSCPLDVHSGNVARKLDLLKRKQNDAKALLELDTALRQLDPKDPVKYDFALFGLGVFEGF